ncbi:MAG TPA: hypothetical protein VN965_09940, partial [Candidatus Dormibacteraeota bacterium]|nr:hypothetical protein [Candidatus Dormibacteraeota bacterium]
MGATQEEYYRGVRMAPYDLLKELVFALAGVGVLAVLISLVLSSPDVAPVTIATWAQQDPVDLVTTATGELAGSTTSAGYGPPYNSASEGQSWGPIAPQKWFGARIPIDSANSFVMQPLQRASFSNTDLGAALSAWQGASADQQSKWLDAYTKALADATVTDGKVVVATGEYGPLPLMMSNLLGVAQAGGLDGLLVINGRFYQTDYTQPLVFMGDGEYLAGLADEAHLTGSLWGMMNETGSYPGQVWLWLYTFWYQIKPFSTSANADILVMAVMGVLSLAFILIPFIPGVRDLPRRIPIYKLIWRQHYNTHPPTLTSLDPPHFPPA